MPAPPGTGFPQSRCVMSMTLPSLHVTDLPRVSMRGHCVTTAHGLRSVLRILLACVDEGSVAHPSLSPLENRVVGSLVPPCISRINDENCKSLTT